MPRSRLNCSVTLDCPRLLTDVISLTAAIWPNCRSSGVATEEAIVSGLAPGSEALTEIVGKSTCGSGETGSSSNAINPKRAIAIVSSVVATGRRMKISEIIISRSQVGQDGILRAIGNRAGLYMGGRLTIGRRLAT